MNVLVIQPGFPAEIPYFVRGLAQSGVRVLGVGDQPKTSLPRAKSLSRAFTPRRPTPGVSIRNRLTPRF